MRGSTWTRAAVAVLAAVLGAFLLACDGGAPDNPTPVPSRSSADSLPSPYPHPTR